MKLLTRSFTNTEWLLRDPADMKSEVSLYTYGHNFFTTEECDYWMDVIESNYSIEQATLVSQDIDRSTRSTGTRISQVAWLTSGIDVIQPLYKKLVDAVNNHNNTFFKFNLTSIETLQYTIDDSNVSKQSRYDWHVDEAFTNNPLNLIRKLSFVLLLTNPSNFTGGNLDLWCDNQLITVNLKQGSIVFFHHHYSTA